jgi:hypothetical protein
VPSSRQERRAARPIPGPPLVVPVVLLASAVDLALVAHIRIAVTHAVVAVAVAGAVRIFARGSRPGDSTGFGT